MVTPPLDGTILPGVTRASVLALLFGWRRPRPGANDDTEAEVVDIVLPAAGGPDSLAQALWQRLVDIQEGRIEWEGWGVPCGPSDA